MEGNVQGCCSSDKSCLGEYEVECVHCGKRVDLGAVGINELGFLNQTLKGFEVARALVDIGGAYHSIGGQAQGYKA